MTAFAAFVPSPPLLVPELAGAAAAQTEDLRAAAVGVAAELAQFATHWIAIGTGLRSAHPATVGTYRGFGVDVVVALSDTAASGEPDADLPLAALTAGWLRERSSAAVSIDFRAVAADLEPQRCTEIGAALAREVAESGHRVGLLVLADGSAAMTDKAPASVVDGAPEFQARIDEALATGDTAALAALTVTDCAEFAVDGRAPWQVLAEFASAAGNLVAAETVFRGAPFGVSYTVGTWRCGFARS